MTPPEVSSPNEPPPYPTRSHSQRTTSSSTNAADRAGMPDVDALVRHLGEQLAHHRDGQWRRREVAELARVLGVHLASCQSRPELIEDLRGRSRGGRGRTWLAAGTEQATTLFVVRGRVAHRALGGGSVQGSRGRRPRSRCRVARARRARPPRRDSRRAPAQDASRTAPDKRRCRAARSDAWSSIGRSSIRW